MNAGPPADRIDDLLLRSRSVSALTRAHIMRLSNRVPCPLMKWNAAPGL